MTTTEQPVNAKWKASMPAFEKAFGKARTGILLGRLIPLHYHGDTLVLGAPSAWHRDHVMRVYSDRLQKILGGPVRVEVSEIARAAEARSKAAGPS